MSGEWFVVVRFRMRFAMCIQKVASDTYFLRTFLLNWSMALGVEILPTIPRSRITSHLSRSDKLGLARPQM